MGDSPPRAAPGSFSAAAGALGTNLDFPAAITNVAQDGSEDLDSVIASSHSARSELPPKADAPQPPSLPESAARYPAGEEGQQVPAKVPVSNVVNNPIVKLDSPRDINWIAAATPGKKKKKKPQSAVVPVAAPTDVIMSTTTEDEPKEAITAAAEDESKAAGGATTAPHQIVLAASATTSPGVPELAASDKRPTPRTAACRPLCAFLGDATLFLALSMLALAAFHFTGQAVAAKRDIQTHVNPDNLAKLSGVHWFQISRTRLSLYVTVIWAVAAHIVSAKRKDPDMADIACLKSLRKHCRKRQTGFVRVVAMTLAFIALCAYEALDKFSKCMNVSHARIGESLRKFQAGQVNEMEQFVTADQFCAVHRWLSMLLEVYESNITGTCAEAITSSRIAATSAGRVSCDPNVLTYKIVEIITKQGSNQEQLSYGVIAAAIAWARKKWKLTVGIHKGKVAPYFITKMMIMECFEVVLQFSNVISALGTQDRGVVLLTFVVLGLNLIVLPFLVLFSMRKLNMSQAALTISFVEVFFDTSFVVVGIFIRSPTKDALQNKFVFHAPVLYASVMALRRVRTMTKLRVRSF
eukprot:g3629.t1